MKYLLVIVLNFYSWLADKILNFHKRKKGKNKIVKEYSPDRSLSKIKTYNKARQLINEMDYDPDGSLSKTSTCEYVRAL